MHCEPLLDITSENGLNSISKLDAGNSIITTLKANLNPSKWASPTFVNKNLQKNAENNFNKGIEITALKMYAQSENKNLTNNSIFENDDDIWTEEKHKAFLEGFNSGKLGNPEKKYYRENSSKRNKPNKKVKQSKWTDKFNIGNPETDDGHWITLDNGKHLFIKNK